MFGLAFGLGPFGASEQRYTFGTFATTEAADVAALTGTPGGGANHPGVTLNPFDKGASLVLSYSDMHVGGPNVGGDVNQIVRATSPFITAGYFEFYVAYLSGSGVAAIDSCGVANKTASLTAILGSDTNSVAYRKDGTIRYNGSTVATVEGYAQDQVIGIAVDTAAIRFYRHGKLVYTYSGTMPTGALYPAAMIGVDGSQWHFNPGAGSNYDSQSPNTFRNRPRNTLRGDGIYDACTWDPSTKSSSIALSGGQLIATSSGGNVGARATVAMDPGDYAEVKMVAASSPGGSIVGLANSSATFTSALTGGTNSIGWSNNGQYYGTSGNAAGPVSAWSSGDVVGIGLTFNNTIEFYKNGVYQFTLNTLPAGSLYLAFTLGNSGETATANFGQSTFSALPSGYTSCDGTQVNRNYVSKFNPNWMRTTQITLSVDRLTATKNGTSPTLSDGSTVITDQPLTVDYFPTAGKYFEWTPGVANSSGWAEGIGVVNDTTADNVADHPNVLDNNIGRGGPGGWGVSWHSQGEKFGWEGDGTYGSIGSTGSFTTGDKVGVLVKTTTVEFYKNGTFVWSGFRPHPEQNCYPAASLAVISPAESGTINLGGPFSYLPSGATAWSATGVELGASDTGSDVTLSNNNLTARTSTPSFEVSRATLGRSDTSGRYFYQVTCDHDGGAAFGFSDGYLNVLNNSLGSSTDGISYWYDGHVQNNSNVNGNLTGLLTWTTGDVVGAVWDPAANHVEFWKKVSGTWTLVVTRVINNSGVFNPYGGVVFPALQMYGTDATFYTKFTVNFGATPMAMPPNTISWDGTQISADLASTEAADTAAVSVTLSAPIISAALSVTENADGMASPISPILKSWHVPKNSANLTLSGSSVLTDADLSGNSRTETGATNKPTLAVTSWMRGNVEKFDRASAQYLTSSTGGSSLSTLDKITVVMLIRPTTLTASTFYALIADNYDQGQGLTFHLYGPNLAIFKQSIATLAISTGTLAANNISYLVSMSFEKATGNWRFRINGATDSSGSYGPVSFVVASDGYWIGNDPATGATNSKYDGYIGERMILASDTLADVERAEGIIAWNSGSPQLLDSAHPYKSVPPGGFAAVGTTLNPNDAFTDFIFSNGNLTASVLGLGDHNLRATKSRSDSSGSWFFSAHMDQTAVEIGIGISNSSSPLSGQMYNNNTAALLQSNGYFNYNINVNGAQNLGVAMFTTGDWVGCLWQPATGTLKFYKLVSGVWTLIYTSPFTITISGAIFPAFTAYGGSSAGGEDIFTANFGATTGAGLAPGTVSWDGTRISVDLASTEAADVAAINSTIQNRGSFALTEAPDVAAVATNLYIGAALNVTEAQDVFANSISIQDQAQLAVTEAADAAAMAVSIQDRGQLVVTEAADVAVFATNLYIGAALAVTEAADASVISGNTVTFGSVATTEAADVAAVAVNIYDPAALTVTEAQDVAAATLQITTPISAALAVTEAPDTAAISETISTSAALVSTEAQDVSAIAGNMVTSIALATTEAADVAAIASTIYDAVAVATTEAPDTAAATITVVNQVQVTSTEAADVAAVAVDIRTNAALAVTEAPDVFANSVSIYDAAAFASTEATDTASIAGTVYNPVSVVSVEAQDVAAISTSVYTPVSVGAQEAPDIAAIAANPVTFAALSVSEGPDTAAVNVNIYDPAALAVTGGQDVAAITIIVLDPISAALATTEAQDTAVLSQTLTTTGQLVSTEGQDVAAIAVTVNTNAALASAETPDAAAIAATIVNLATLAATEAPDILAASVNSGPTGAISVSEAPDVSAIAGNMVTFGSIGTSEAPDICAALMFIGSALTLAASEAQDTASISVGLTTFGTLGATEAQDAAFINAGVQNPPISAALAATEGQDVADFAGSIEHRLQLAVTEAQDTAAGAATVVNRVQIAAIEGQDVAAIAAQVITSGDLASTEARDTCAISAQTGFGYALAASEAPDTLSGSGDIIVQISLASSEGPDVASMDMDVRSTIILQTSEAPDTAIIHLGGVLIPQTTTVRGETDDEQSIKGEVDRTQPAGGGVAGQTSVKGAARGTITLRGKVTTLEGTLKGED